MHARIQVKTIILTLSQKTTIFKKINRKIETKNGKKKRQDLQICLVFRSLFRLLEVAIREVI